MDSYNTELDSYITELISAVRKNIDAAIVRKWLEENFMHEKLSCPTFENIACIGCPNADENFHCKSNLF